jgi:hypothetical protein
MCSTIAGITMPDSQMARDLTQLIRDTEADLLFHHSTRVYLFGALTGQLKGLQYDPELVYVGARKPLRSRSQDKQVCRATDVGLTMWEGD